MVAQRLKKMKNMREAQVPNSNIASFLKPWPGGDGGGKGGHTLVPGSRNRQNDENTKMKQLKNQRPTGQPALLLKNYGVFPSPKLFPGADIGAKRSNNGAGRNDTRFRRRAEACGLVRPRLWTVTRRGLSVLCAEVRALWLFKDPGLCFLFFSYGVFFFLHCKIYQVVILLVVRI